MGFHIKPIYRGNYLKRGTWTAYRFNGGLGEKEGSGVFEGVDTPMNTMGHKYQPSLEQTASKPYHNLWFFEGISE